MTKETLEDIFSKFANEARIHAICSDIEQELTEMMFEHNEDNLSPSEYLDLNFDVIYEKVMMDDELAKDSDFKDTIHDMLFKIIDFESVLDTINETKQYVNNPYTYNGVSRDDFL